MEYLDRTMESPIYSPSEENFLSFLQKRAREMYEEREESRFQFDDKTYSENFQDNSKGGLSYNPITTNEGEWRIVSGTTRQKVVTQVSSLLSFNFNFSILPINKSSIPDIKLGKRAEELIESTLEQENFKEDILPNIFKEYAIQGDAFCQNIVVDRTETIKKISNNSDLSKAEWKTRERQMLPEARLKQISGINFFPGNINIAGIENQPDIIYLDLITYSEAKSLYGKLKNFNYVPKNTRQWNDKTIEYKNGINEAVGSSMSVVDSGMVEVMFYEDKWNNNFNFTLNGVLMLPVYEDNDSFPLTHFSPSGEYTIAKMSNCTSFDFFYSKSIPQDTFVLQNAYDEFLRLIMEKMESSFKGSLINKGTVSIDEEIFRPGGIFENPDFNEGDIFPAIANNNTGVTSSEFSTMQFIKNLIDEGSYSPTFSGQDSQGDKTLGEIQIQQRQNLKKLGGSLVGVTSFLKQIGKLRLYSILDTYTNSEDLKGELSKIGRNLLKETTFENGKKGLKIIKFKKSNLESEEIKAINDTLSEEHGKPIKIEFLDPVELRKTIEYNWIFSVEPTPKDSSELRKAQRSEAFARLYSIPMIAPRINNDFVGDTIAIDNDIDPDELFRQNTQQQMQQPQQQLQSGNVESQLLRGLQSQNTKPSINTLQEE